ncbi:hypothetical protein KM043_016711 [Ampulex compressa]|nr:hypothetical protein KM043_016711 [Ampulex compressa]
MAEEGSRGPAAGARGERREEEENPGTPGVQSWVSSTPPREGPRHNGALITPISRHKSSPPPQPSRGGTRTLYLRTRLVDDYLPALEKPRRRTENKQ